MRVPGAVLSTAVLLLAAPEPTQVVVVNPGGWTLHGQSLHRNQRLSSLAELEGTPAAGDLLLACGSSHGTISYSCKSPHCRIPVCATQAEDVRIDTALRGHPESQTPSFFSSLFRREPMPLAILGVREAGSISDALVSIDGTRLHLAPALKRVHEGKYCFSFKSLSDSEPRIATATLDWDSSVEPEGISDVPGLLPGLYAVRKGNSACEFDPDTVPAWILVIPSAAYPKISAIWQSYAPDLLQLETSGAGPSTVTTMRRAVLANLADTYESK